MAGLQQIAQGGSGGAQTVPDFGEILALVRENVESVSEGMAVKVLSDAAFDKRSPASSAADRSRKAIGKALGLEEGRVTTAIRKVGEEYRFWIVLLSDEDAQTAGAYGTDAQGRSAFVAGLAEYRPPTED